MSKLFSTTLILVCSVLLFSSCKKDECDIEPNLEVNQTQLQQDIEAIDAYLQQQNIDAQVHPSGIRYVIEREGDGDRPKLCDRVAVTYTGRLISNGSVFDESRNIITFGLSNLITGWQVGIPLVEEGGIVTLYIPSVYGYGAQGSPPNIPGNANLEFRISLFGVQ